MSETTTGGINWDNLTEQLAKKPGARKDFIKEAPIPKMSTAYFRVTTFKDSEGNVQLMRKVRYHWVSTMVQAYDKTAKKYKVDAEGQPVMEIAKRVIPCEGENCRFCALAKELKEAGCKDEYMFRYNTKILVLGAFVEKAGTTYVYPNKGSDGYANLVPLVFDSGSRQDRTFNNFMTPENLFNLSETNPLLANKTMNQIMSTVWGRDNGLIFKFESKKNSENRWDNTMSAMLQALPLPPEANVNLDEVFNEFSQEFLDTAYKTTAKVVNDILGRKQSYAEESMYEPEAKPALADDTPPFDVDEPKPKPTKKIEEPKVESEEDPMAMFNDLFGGAK